MHFITGGAFNGKSKWVKEHYHLEEIPHHWISAYQGNPLPYSLSEWKNTHVVVLEGVEVFMKEWSSRSEIHVIREKWRNFLEKWLEWEKEDQQRKLILIGTDLSKGIVPMLAEERKWRDLTGWVYQDTTAASERVDLIWYGINKKLK